MFPTPPESPTMPPPNQLSRPHSPALPPPLPRQQLRRETPLTLTIPLTSASRPLSATSSLLQLLPDFQNQTFLRQRLFLLMLLCLLIKFLRVLLILLYLNLDDGRLDK